MAIITAQSKLPELRQELQVRPGAQEINGNPTWLIFDPVVHRYFQIDEKNAGILNHWHLQTAGELLQLLVDQGVTLDDIDELVRFIYVNSLALHPPEDDIRHFVTQADLGKRSFLSGALHNYLFFRLPLCRPHAFLKKTRGLTDFFWTRIWWIFILILAITGLYLTSRQWDQFVHTFMHFFNTQGLIYYGVALVVVKCAHELGHAYAATRYGCRVTTMGIALLVMFPVLFTDTTDSWKLTCRKQRLIISGAGVAVELVIAVIATFLWAFLDDGVVRSAAFFIATTSWTMSLAVNCNPLMRFDGYHFLSDAVGVQNLQARCFAMGRWSLREFLFGLGEAPPEAMSMRRRRFLIMFAWCTWVYRFFLFLGIAVLVHHFFFKPLGAVLSIVEVLFFIGVPIMKELSVWFGLRHQLFEKPSTWRTISVCALLILVAVIPWRGTLRIPAVMEAREHIQLFAPQVAEVEQILVRSGQQVAAGERLMQLNSTVLDNNIARTGRRIDLAKARLDKIAVDLDELGQKVVLQQELAQLQEELAGYLEQSALLNITAPAAGVVADLDPTLHVGRTINDRLPLASIVSLSGARVRGFVSAGDVSRLAGGEQSVFVPDLLEIKKVSGFIKLVDTAHAKNLTIPALASHYDGPIAVTRENQQLTPLKAWYNISMDLEETEFMQNQLLRGELLTTGEPESLLGKFWRRAAHVVLREINI